MTLTLLDLYNSTATQEWAMYDNDALSESEFEASLVLALNKSIIDIYATYIYIINASCCNTFCNVCSE